MKIYPVIGSVLLVLVLSGCGLFGESKKAIVVKKPVEIPVVEMVSLIHYTPVDTLSPILEQAKIEKKAVFIDFYTTWCMPCRMMDETVFRDEDLADYMNKNILSLKVNAEMGNGINLRTIYDVKAYPTMVFLDGNGNELARKEGSCSTTDFKKMAKTAVWKIKSAQ